MKKVIILLFFIAAMVSCEKNKLKPDASFKIFAADVECKDSIPVNKAGYILFTGYTDKGGAVIFTGHGRLHNNYSDSSDFGVDVDSTNMVYFKYTTKGEKDTIVCLATATNSKNDAKQAMKQKIVTIY